MFCCSASFQTGYHFGETPRKDTGTNMYGNETNWTKLAKDQPAAARAHDYKAQAIAGKMNLLVDKVLSTDQLQAEAENLMKDGQTWAVRRTAEKQAAEEAEERADCSSGKRKADKQPERSRRKRGRISEPFPVALVEGQKLLSMQTVIGPKGSSQHTDQDGMGITACSIRETGGCGECHVEQVSVCECQSDENAASGKSAQPLHSHAGLMQAMYFPSLRLAVVLRAGDFIVWDPRVIHGCTQDMVVGNKRLKSKKHRCKCRVKRFTFTAYTRKHTLSQ